MVEFAVDGVEVTQWRQQQTRWVRRGAGPIVAADVAVLVQEMSRT